MQMFSVHFPLCVASAWMNSLCALVEECSQNGFAVEMRTLPLIFLLFDKEKANEKNLLIHLLLWNYFLKCRFLYLVRVYDNFILSQYARNFFLSFIFRIFCFGTTKIYIIYIMSFLVLLYTFWVVTFKNIPVITFWCNVSASLYLYTI